MSTNERAEVLAIVGQWRRAAEEHDGNRRFFVETSNKEHAAIAEIAAGLYRAHAMQLEGLLAMEQTETISPAGQ